MNKNYISKSISTKELDIAKELDITLISSSLKETVEEDNLSY